MCLISAIIFAFAVKNAEYHPDKEGEEDTEFIRQIEEYKKRQEK
jgi:hypothetical protein